MVFRQSLKLIQGLRFLTTGEKYLIVFPARAEVAELADALESGSSERKAHAGSTPAFGTIFGFLPLPPETPQSAAHKKAELHRGTSAKSSTEGERS